MDHKEEWAVRLFRSRDRVHAKALERAAFGDHQVDWKAIRTAAGQERYRVYVIRNHANVVVAAAVLDNRRGDRRYDAGWAALDTLMRNLDPIYDSAKLGHRLLDHIQARLIRRPYVGSEPIQGLYCRVRPNQPRLVQWYLKHGFVFHEEDHVLTWTIE